MAALHLEAWKLASWRGVWLSCAGPSWLQHTLCGADAFLRVNHSKVSPLTPPELGTLPRRHACLAGAAGGAA